MQVHSLCIAIADKLRERILSHQMPPGSDINDGALAQEYGVSRTPVREAMKLLCHEGLLTAQPRRGMTVTCLNTAQVAEAQQLCNVLANHLHALQHAHSPCTELTQRVHAIAKARLQLALGPAPAAGLHTPRPASQPISHTASHPFSEQQRAALAH